MGRAIDIIGGENITVERKQNDFVIHGAPLLAPENSAGKGFFKMNVKKRGG